MKIRDIKLHLLPDIPLSQPIRCAWSPGKPYTFIGSSFVEVQTDEASPATGRLSMRACCAWPSRRC